jgi:hypothetical protein
MSDDANPSMQALRHLISLANECLPPEARERTNPTDQPTWRENYAVDQVPQPSGPGVPGEPLVMSSRDHGQGAS